MTNTYTIALPAATKLVKTGTGCAVLKVDATSTFTGSVEIEEGTLQLNHRYAAGKGTAIGVTGDAATLYLYLQRPSDAGQYTQWFTNPVTIRGQGVDGLGALRYKALTSGNDDRMMKSLSLSDDAYLGLESRWGVSGTLNLNGHTLSWINSTGTWFFTCDTLVISAGKIVNAKGGTITFQQPPIFSDPENTLIEQTSSGIINLWGLDNKNYGVNCPVSLTAGAIRSSSGTGPFKNNFNQRVTINNQWSSIIAANGDGLARDLSISGEFVLKNDVYKKGAGKLFLHGPVTAEQGYFYNQGTGWTIATNDAVRSFKSFTQNVSGSKFWLGGGSMTVTALRIGNSGCRNSFYQTGGTFSDNKWDTARIGEGTGNSYGSWTMTGGTTIFRNHVNLAESGNTQGLLIQKGGEFRIDQDKDVDYSGTLRVGGRARGEMFVSGGATNDTHHAVSNDRIRLNMSQYGGFSTVTVTGKDSLVLTDTLAMGCPTNDASTVVNIANGGTLAARRFYKNRTADSTGESLAVVNVDGGILKLRQDGGFGYGTNSSLADIRSVDHFIVHSGGLVLDSSEATSAVEFTHHLDAPTGKRIASITLPDYTNTKGYYGPAMITINGPEGSYGATAFADFDFGTTNITGAIVTGHGCNYDETTTITLCSPAATKQYECTYTLEDNPPAGPLTKRGAGEVRLYAANACSATIVEGGTLKGVNAGTIPDGKPLDVKSGATLDLNGHPLTVTTAAGGGTVTGAAVTVTQGFVITAEELFTDKSPLTFTDGLTIAAGATVTVADPENLDKYRKQLPVSFLRAVGGWTGGTPTLVTDGLPNGWSVYRLGNDLKFGIPKGTVLTIR